ncbi:MAG: hypothetical protein ACOX2A_02540 [Tepidanaerobacteraceae bacterium]|nr:hypothetical protein [Thermoanaerobacterales bacterium]
MNHIRDGRGSSYGARVYMKSWQPSLKDGNYLFSNIIITPLEGLEATPTFGLLQDVFDDISKVGTMLRKNIKKEAIFD